MWSERKPSSHVRADVAHWTVLLKLTLLSVKKKKNTVFLFPFRISAHSWSFSWRRNGKYYNVARDPQASMRRHSGTLDIYAWNNPEQYEAEYQCIASNEYGSAYSNKIRLRLYSKISTETIREPTVCLYPPLTYHWQQMHNDLSVCSDALTFFLSVFQHSETA